MSDLLNKVIQIASKEEKPGPFGPMVKIKDQDGKTYTVFKTKKDGTTSVAWDGMPAVGDTVQVGYAEEDGEYEGKAFKRRTVRSFNADIGNGVANTEKQRSEPSTASQSQSDDKFWDKKAYKQCLWNYWLENNSGKKTADDWMGDVWNIFNQIEKDADERFSKPKGWSELGAKLKEQVAPDIQESADEMAAEAGIGEDIPF
jgi:hypothetical protein